MAERIADLEDLDSAPRDAVSRAFREMPIELTTLERIARALNVEVHTLYLTADEVAEESVDKAGNNWHGIQQDDNGKEQPEADSGVPQRRGLKAAAVALAVLAVAAVALTGLYERLMPEGTKAIPSGVSVPLLDLGTSTLIVQPFEGDDDGELANALRTHLAKHFSVASATAGALTAGLATNEAAETLRSDAVVEGDVVTVGRLSAVRVYLFAAGIRHQVWAESLPHAAFADKRDSIAINATNAVLRASGVPLADDAPAKHFPLTPVQDDYLEGEYHLDQPSSELNIKRAQSRFEAALRQDANYARAHAGLCQSLLEEHWMANEERALQDAARACGQALQLDADDSVVATAHAHFLRRTGRNDEALNIYADIVERNPEDS
ncbi:MAG: tetratricopeptide repeat protein, partial [Halioglobus sp.]|nr:tetratricopeptide repeat protein [Halioglobus sp.]